MKSLSARHHRSHTGRAHLYAVTMLSEGGTRFERFAYSTSPEEVRDKVAKKMREKGAGAVLFIKVRRLSASERLEFDRMNKAVYGGRYEVY